MARADPWAQFDDAPEEQAHSRQPAQQAMGRGAPAAAPAAPAAAPEADPFAQFAMADPASPEAQDADAAITDEPVAVSRLAPEDEAKVRQYIAAGDAQGAEAFAASKGFHLTNAKQLADHYTGSERNIPESVYQLDKVETGAPDAAARGFMDTVSAGTLPKVGAVIAGTESALTGGNFGDAYDHMLDSNNAAVGADERDHPWMRLSGQLLGGLAIPTGLEGVGLKAGSEVLRAGGTMADARAAATIAVRNRMAAVGGGYGAAHGAGSADNVPDAVKGALVEGTVGAATGGAIGAAGQVLQPRFAARIAAARAAPMTDGQKVAAAADRIGMDVLPADVGGAATRRMTGAAAQSPLSASPVISAAQRVIEQGKGVRDSVAAQAGTAADAEMAGETAASGARAFMRSSRSRIGRIYDTAKSMAGDIRLPLTNARAELEAQIAQLAEVPGAKQGLGNAGKELKEATQLREALNGDFTVQGVRDMRTEMFVSPDFRGTPLERRLGRVVDAAAADIEQGLVNAGKTDAARAFASADKQWRERLKTIQRVIEPIIGKSEEKAKSGEEIIAALQRASKGNAARLRGFLDALPPDEAGMTRATLINHLGHAAPGAQNAEGNAFSLGKFLTDWDKLGEGSKRALFGAEGRASLNDLATVANGTKEAQRYASFSNTPGGIWGNLGLLAGSAAYAPKTAAFAAATQLISGRMLASPRFARWLARAPKTQLSGPAYIDRLGRIARAEPAIAGEVLNLQQRLSEAMAVTPQRAAASDKTDSE